MGICFLIVTCRLILLVDELSFGSGMSCVLIRQKWKPSFPFRILPENHQQNAILGYAKCAHFGLEPLFLFLEGFCHALRFRSQDFAPVDEQNWGAGNRDCVPVADLLDLYFLTIHHRAVSRAQILDEKFVLAEQNACMVARNQRLVDDDVVVDMPADVGSGIFDWEQVGTHD